MKEHGQNSKIFIRNLTVLDCGIWDHHRGPIGCSWFVDVTWIGKTDHEGVVVDFSEAKKIAKKVIDEQFDHRLLISKDKAEWIGDGRFLCIPHHSTSPQNRFLIETYEKSLALLPDCVLEELTAGDKKQLEKELGQAILIASPKNVAEVIVKLSEHQERSALHFFNYLHSLKLHSGNCQRFHGHSNTVEVCVDGKFNKEFSESVAKFLNGKYLVTDSYVDSRFNISNLKYSDVISRLEINQTNYSWIEYSGTQGLVRVFVPKERLVLLPSESTIENITEWIHSCLLSGRSDVSVYGFEGLNKGAIYP